MSLSCPKPYFKMVDLHSHILPGLDDGAQSMEESVQIARKACDGGIQKIVATTHLFRGDFLPCDFGRIEEKRQELVKALDDSSIAVEVFRGAEVHISHNLIEEIRENREYLVLNQGSYMFVEFPSEHVYTGVKNLFFELMSEGITPIIAHPERNSVFIRNPALLYELVEMGALSQANSGSFVGLYGRTTQETIYRMLELGLVHFIASDCHSPNSGALDFSGVLKRASDVVGGKNASALVMQNPQAVLEDKEIPFRPEPVHPKSKGKSFYVKIPDFLRRKKRT